jgi:two-component system response regulator YesN
MLKVAIVEDEELVRQGLALAVDWSRMGCLLVGTAADGQEGMELIRSAQPDFVLTDVRMPRMDGLTMVHMLRSEGCTAEFIILTAYSDFEYAHRALRLGVTDYLLKPFQDEELEAAVEKIRVRLNERAAATVSEGAGVMRFDLEKGSKSKYIEEAIGYLREHYGEDLSLAQVAEAINLSEGYLSRLFKKETGYTFNNYLTLYRIHTAMHLLKDCHKKVYEVSEEVGFADTTYFSTLFKKHVGLTPSEYQDRCE